MRIEYGAMTTQALGLLLLSLTFSSVPPVLAGQFGTPKENEGTRIFKSDEHPYYSGQFHLSGQRTTLIGSVSDHTPWDHLDYAGKHLKSVQGTIDIEVNELTNSGKVVAEFVEGPTAIESSLTGLPRKLRSRMEALRQESMNMVTPETAIRCIQKPGSTLPDGGRRRCGKTIRSYTRTMMPISWSWNGPAIQKPMRFTIP